MIDKTDAVRLEAAARAIAALKRGVPADHDSVNRCWTSYVGAARVAVNTFLYPNIHEIT